MKVLVISSTVSPYISVGNITLELNKYLLNKGYDSYVVYYDNSDNPNRKYYKRIRAKILNMLFYQLCTRSHYLFSRTPFTVKRIQKIINEYNPDVIHLIQQVQCYINNQELFTMLGKTDIPCVYTMIDENPYLGECDNAYSCDVYCGAGCIKCKGDNYAANYNDFHHRWSINGCRRVAKQKAEGYSNISRICFVAPQWVTERAKKSRLLKERIIFSVDEYVDNIHTFYPRCITREMWLKKNIDIKKVIILNVAKYSNTRKGVKDFIELAKRMEEFDEYVFINVGYDGEKVSLPTNFIPIPFIHSQDELAELLTMADLHVTTSYSDTMPNILLEALSCGTPVCGYKISGIPFVADEPIGHFVEPGDVGELVEMVKRTGKKSVAISNMCREYSLKRYSPKVCIEKYISIYNSMLNNKCSL